MTDEACVECDRLWKKYETAVRAFFKVEGKLKLALLSGDDESARRVEIEIRTASDHRLRLSADMETHEGQTHPPV